VGVAYASPAGMTHTDEKLHKLLEQQDTGMLVTRGEDGRLRGRPMAIAKLDEEDNIFFITALDSSKVSELESEPDVNVSFLQKGRSVSIAGMAHVIQDRALVEQLWSKAFELWFPDGPKDPNVCVVVVHPEEGEYWDDKGLNRIKLAVRAVAAFASGERVEHDFTEHDRVKLT
jgi:general stress protein 26